MTVREKLFEVALPLDAINKASAREKSIRHGHPSTMHLWWVQRPLAAARVVIFAQTVDDPSANPDVFPSAEAQENERERLFKIIKVLVQRENTTNETVLQAARAEIGASWQRAGAENAHHPRARELFDPDKLPAIHDPLAGGGALPLEAQRLGLICVAEGRFATGYGNLRTGHKTRRFIATTAPFGHPPSLPLAWTFLSAWSHRLPAHSCTPSVTLRASLATTWAIACKRLCSPCSYNSCTWRRTRPALCSFAPLLATSWARIPHSRVFALLAGVWRRRGPAPGLCSVARTGLGEKLDADLCSFARFARKGRSEGRGRRVRDDLLVKADADAEDADAIAAVPVPPALAVANAIDGDQTGEGVPALVRFLRAGNALLVDGDSISA